MVQGRSCLLGVLVHKLGSPLPRRGSARLISGNIWLEASSLILAPESPQILMWLSSPSR